MSKDGLLRRDKAGPSGVTSEEEDEEEYMEFGHDAHDPLLESTVSTMITWQYKGNQVAIEGSWDDWKRRSDACDLSRIIT